MSAGKNASQLKVRVRGIPRIHCKHIGNIAAYVFHVTLFPPKQLENACVPLCIKMFGIQKGLRHY